MRSFRPFYRSECGGTLILFGLMLPVLLVCMGIAIDIGRLYAVHSKAQNALDASLLGAVSTKDLSPPDQEILRLFNANYPANYMGSNIGAIGLSTDGTGAYNAQVTITVPTVIMQIFPGFGVNTMNVNSQATTGFNVVREQRLELALALDNTGSMQGAKISALRQASIDLVNIIFNGASSLNNVHMSVVPFDTDVNIGAGHDSWVQNAWQFYYTDYAKHSAVGDNYLSNRNNDGIVDSGGNPIGAAYSDFSDNPPLTEDTKFRVPPRYSFDPAAWFGQINCGSGAYWDNPDDNLDFVCPTLAPLAFGMNTPGDVAASINQMKANGNTRINVGLMWSWFTLSPKWQGVWDAAKPDLPASPDPRYLTKAVVLMTDGKNTVYCKDPAVCNTANDDDNTTKFLCANMKAQGIVIYAIGFGTEGDINTDLLSNCASQPVFPYYILAPTTEQLRTAFHAIGDDIIYKTLRLSK